MLSISLPSLHPAELPVRRAAGSLLALLRLDGLRFDGASPYGLGRGDGGLVGFGSVAGAALVVGGGAVVRRFPSLVEPRHFADLGGLELLLLLL